MQHLKQKIKQLIGPSLQKVIYTSGIMQLSARIKQVGGAIILMYHSVAGPKHSQWIDPHNHIPSEVFEKQMLFLAAKRKVISLNTLVTKLKHGHPPEDGSIIITFDDGYLDNLTIAAPILKKYNLPATLFLPTSYIDREETQWIDQIYSTFKYRTNNKLLWAENIFDLRKNKAHKMAYHIISKSILKAGEQQRHYMLKQLRDQLQPNSQAPRLTLNWSEIRTLTANTPGFDIGGHTLEHTDMTNISTPVAQIIFKNCKQRIHQMTNITPHLFSFPYGRSSKQLRNLVINAGFSSAVSCSDIDPVITSSNDIFTLPRVEAPSSMARFELITSTVNTGFWRRLEQ